MNQISLRLGGVVVVALLMTLTLGAQAPAEGAEPPAEGQQSSDFRLPDGTPDLQGIWTNVTVTPLERPTDLADQPFFESVDEARAYAAAFVERTNADRRDGTARADISRAYNDFWWDRGTDVIETLRTSLVVDPPDGRIPAQTDAARQRATDRRAANQGSAYDGPENRPLAERCIVWPNEGPPMLPSFYNNNYQIVQSPGYVVILLEMIHDVRVIPTDGRDHLPDNVRSWLGDSVGHWEGDTLVVETTNYNDQMNFRGANVNLRVVERFTRSDEDTLMYAFTVEDSTTWERPWSGEIPMLATEGPIYEYACQEGNASLAGVLSGARVREAREAEAGEAN